MKFTRPSNHIGSYASDPSSGVAGNTYYNTVSQSLKVCTGSAWSSIGGGGGVGGGVWGSITGTLADQTDLQTALNLKAPIASPTFTGTVGGITKSMVGLGSVDNTSDSAKPVSTAQQTALDLKANLASPTLTTPILGVASITSINKMAITAPVTNSTLAVADGKTFTASNTLTFTGTDGSSVAFGAGGTVPYTSNNLSVFASTTSAQLAGVLSDKIGTGKVLFSDPVINAQTGTSYTLVTSDNGRIVTLSNASAITVTIPSGLGASFNCVIVQKGAGQITLSASGTTLNSGNGLKSRVQHSQISLFSDVADNFFVGGDTTT